MQNGRYGVNYAIFAPTRRKCQRNSLFGSKPTFFRRNKEFGNGFAEVGVELSLAQIRNLAGASNLVSCESAGTLRVAARGPTYRTGHPYYPKYSLYNKITSIIRKPDPRLARNYHVRNSGALILNLVLNAPFLD